MIQTKKEYTQPRLIEYGRVEEVTLGAAGTQIDYLDFTLQTVPGNPNCTTNSSACVYFS